jgi:lantibiotic biosynthesis protein
MSPAENRRESTYEASFFALRTPLLPFQDLVDLTSDLETPAALEQDPGRLDAERSHLRDAVQRDRERIRERMREMLQRPHVREAIFVASPDLSTAIGNWEKDPTSSDSLQIEESLYRYLSRMCYRCTPFGMFAGCAVGTIGERSELTIDAAANYRRSTRLDMGYLESMTEALGTDPAVRETAQYRVNSSLYRASGRYRYAESRTDKHGRSYHLVAVTPTPYLEHVLERASAGATIQDLVAALCELGVEFDDARGFVIELIDSQLLISTLAPTLTGPEPIHGLIEKCTGHEATQPVADALTSVRDQLAALDRDGLEGNIDQFPAIAEQLRELPGKVEASRLFQVDMFKPSQATLSQSVIDEVMRGAAILHLASGNAARQDSFQSFFNSFFARYETREVPLVEVLDEESGVGFFKSNAPGSEPSPLLDDVQFASVSDSFYAWGQKERLLLHVLLDARERGVQTVDISGPVLSGLVQHQPSPLPSSFAAMATIAAESQEAFEAGDYRLHVSGCSGPSGANLLGRFCHGDPELTERVQEHVAIEESHDPDCVFAEVVHLPEGRVGNVLLRPLLRKHEIPFCGQSGLDSEGHIPITDLMVSVVGRSIVLRSKSLNKRVLPRLSTAHGFSSERNLGLYRFLCMLQSQGLTGGMAWNWGPFEGSTFLPRLTCGKLVLSRARWIVTAGELKKAMQSDGADRIWNLRKLREGRKLPRTVVLADSDNELLVDFENPLSVDSFFKVVKARPSLLLKEVFAEPHELAATGPEGAFTHELLIPFVLPAKTATQPDEASSVEDRTQDGASVAAAAAAVATSESSTAPAAAPAVRKFPPGSEWMYAKFYAGTATCDEILADVIGPLAQEMMTEGHVDKWFFLRYGDPDWHVRVRLHGDPAVLHSEVLPKLEALAAPLLADGRMWRFQLDTYEQEVERYGGSIVMPIAEEIFCADSIAAIAPLEHFAGDELADARWRLALAGTDRICDDLGFDLRERHALMARLSEGYAHEFHFKGTPLQHQTGRKFREERKDLEWLLNPEKRAEHPLAVGLPAFEERSRLLAPIVERLKAAEAEGNMTVSMREFAGSLIHMHTNRVLRSSARAQELLIYDFLHRLYESQIARQRSRKRTSKAK